MLVYLVAVWGHTVIMFFPRLPRVPICMHEGIINYCHWSNLLPASPGSPAWNMRLFRAGSALWPVVGCYLAISSLYQQLTCDLCRLVTLPAPRRPVGNCIISRGQPLPQSEEDPTNALPIWPDGRVNSAFWPNWGKLRKGLM